MIRREIITKRTHFGGWEGSRNQSEIKCCQLAARASGCSASSPPASDQPDGPSLEDLFAVNDDAEGPASNDDRSQSALEARQAGERRAPPLI
jgi:hypothetical protein